MLLKRQGSGAGLGASTACHGLPKTAEATIRKDVCDRGICIPRPGENVEILLQKKLITVID